MDSRVRSLLLFLAATTLAINLAHADVLASETGTNAITPFPLYMGVEFSVGPAGSFNGIQFDFLANGTTPYAVGTGYLFSSAYTGLPSGLSSAPGALGSAVASGGFYSFGSSVILDGGATYYFYSDTVTPGGFTGEVGSSSTFLSAVSASADFGGVANEAPDFEVQGSAVPVTATPEPGSLGLLVTGCLGVTAAWKRRRRL